MTARRSGLLAVVVVALACLMLALLPTTRGALIGTIRNTQSTAASGIYAGCTTAANAIGSALFVHPMDDPQGTVADDVSGNGRDGTYYGGVTLNQTGPCSGSSGRSVLLDGSSGFVHNPTQQTNPQVFSVQVWFRAPSGLGTGGKLIGFGNGAGSSQSGSYDRHIYMQNDGRLTFGVYPNAIRTVTSSSRYNDGNWHHAVATLGPLTNANRGMRLYVDGSLVASDGLTTSAENFSGYWRMGFDNLNTWTNAPSSYYFRGNLAYGAVWSTVLTPAQVSALYAARNG